MDWKEENRYKILKVLLHEKNIRNDKLQSIYFEFKSMFQSESLWIVTGERGQETYNISERGKMIYHYLKSKKRQEYITWLLLWVATAAAIIAAIPVIKEWIFGK